MLCELQSSLLISALIAVVSLSGCGKDISKTSNAKERFFVMQPFVNKIISTHNETGIYPRSSQDLFSKSDWPEYDIISGEMTNEFLISPKTDRSKVIYATYTTTGSEATLHISGIGQFGCSWRTEHSRWICPQSWP